MKARILRWNRLKRRAAALGVDVQTLIRLDAAAQRELLPEAATMDAAEEIIPAAPEVKGA